MNPTEAQTLKSICDYLDRTNEVWLRHSPSNVVGKKGEATFRRIRDSQKGAPDLLWWDVDLLTWPGGERTIPSPIAIEVKSPTGKQSKDQVAWQQKFEAVGGSYWIVRSIDAFLEKAR